MILAKESLLYTINYLTIFTKNITKISNYFHIEHWIFKEVFKTYVETTFSNE